MNASSLARLGATLLGGVAAIGLLAGDPALARVGVTSQTTNNPQGTPPQQRQRTLQVGIDVFADERIQTTANDRAHLLFLDGSSLTVGPNSDLKIDRFVYDPASGKGELAVSAAKGIFRLVGGKITKSNEATIKVGTSTIGIRGGITIVNAPECPAGTPPAECQAQAYFMFGQQLTVSNPDGTQTAVRPGSLIAFAGDGPPAPPVVAPPDSLIGPIAQLEAPSGAGNTGPGPSAGTIEQQTRNSGLPPTNSGAPPNPPGPPAGAQFASNLTGAGGAIGPGPDPTNPNRNPPLPGGSDNEPPPPPPPVTVTISAEGRFLREEPNSSVTFDAFGITAVRDPMNNAFLQSASVTTTGGTTTLVSDPGTLNVTTVTGVTFSLPWTPGAEPTPVSGTSSVGPVAGNAFVSPNGDFYAYSLEETANDNRGIGFFGGERTLLGQLPETGFASRQFITLDGTAPFLPEFISGEPVVANATQGLAHIAWSPVLGNGGESQQRATWFQATLNIEGQGEAQSSYLSITTGVFFTDDDAELYAGGGGQTFIRRSAFEGPIKFTSAASSAETQNGSAIYGPAGEYMVLVPERLEEGEGGTVRTPSAAGSLPFDTLEVTDVYYPVVISRPTTGPADLGTTRTSETLTGFTGALIERENGSGGYSSYAVYNVTPDQVQISKDATTNRVEGFFNMTTGAPPADSLSLLWGSTNGSSSQQQSAFIDDKRFAMREAGAMAGSYNGESVVTQMSMVTQAAVADADFLPAGVSFCTCQYLTWGYWQADLNYISGARAGQRDYVTLGTWVTGTATADIDLPMTGSATYTGHIIGNVENDMGNSYVAVGQIDTTWDFGSRTGGLAITNFDGANYAGTTFGSPGTGNFGGSFTGVTPGATDREGQVWGAFFRSPTDATLYQAGNFKLNSTESNYKAAGTFAAQRNGPVGPPIITTFGGNPGQ